MYHLHIAFWRGQSSMKTIQNHQDFAQPFVLDRVFVFSV